MIELVLRYPDGKEKRLSFEKEGLMLGKAAGNDVVLEGEGISRYHARLLVEDAKLLIEDLGSTNGTLLNAKAVKRERVMPGDKILLGTVLVEAALTEVAVSEETEERPAARVEEKSLSKTDERAEGGSVNDSFYWQSLQSFLAPIWDFVIDDSISEIMVNGPSEVFIERKGHLERRPEVFSNDQLQAAILNIAQYVGRRIGEEEPYLDARLPDGSRVAVLLAPCSRKGTAIAIRKFSREALTLDKLVAFGSLTPQMLTYLRAVVRLRKNIIISGGTSSGKTSLLNVISSLIPEDERILTIEDSAELQLSQEHLLPMETKPADKKGRGQVTIRDLVKVSLRMRPDRIIVGEIRGGEAIDLLQAMNTGHSGSMATLHASSPRQALSRLETLALFSGLEIPMRALREQVASAVDIVIQAARLPDHSRKVTHISEIGPLREDGSYEVMDIFRFERKGLGSGNKIEGGHRLSGASSVFLEEMELAGMSEAVELFAETEKHPR